MIRVLKGQSGVLSLPRPSKPTSATVTITRNRDGVTIVNAAACVAEADRVVYSLAAQSSVSNLTAVFTIVEEDASTSTVSIPVQVVGVRTASVDDCRRLRPLDNVNKYPDSLIESAITAVEDALEAACGVSFVPVERVGVRCDGSGTRELFCRHGKPVSVSTVSISDGTSTQTLSNTELSAIVIDEEAGVLIRRDATWPKGRRNVLVTGVFGMSTPPGLVREAVVKQVRYLLVDSPAQDRALSITNEDGTTSTMVVAGTRGYSFAIPEMNQIVSQYRQAFGVA